MARVEKTVFISYRRTDVYTALAVYENLKNQGYDVFFDYRSISSGDFEQIITSNIKARAHFLLILTPTALDRCNEPGDWLRHEIEFAIDEKRNIIPLFFKGFRFGDPSVTEKLTGKLKNLTRYNGLNVHEDYFDEAMYRLRTQYLNIPLETVLHPVSTEVLKVVREEQVAADKALEQIEDVKELVKQFEEKPQAPKAKPTPRRKRPAPSIDTSSPREKTAEKPGVASLETSTKPKPAISSKTQELVAPVKVAEKPVLAPTFNFRLLGGVAGGLLILGFLIWGASRLFRESPVATPESTSTFQVNVAFASQPSTPITSELDQATTPLSTTLPSSPTSSLGIGSTMTGKDGMTLLYIPAGEFNMGSHTGKLNESPVHTVYLDAFWIDQIEVTNKMYSLCVMEANCLSPQQDSSYSHSDYYGNSQYDNYPVVHLNWNMAKTYCEWAGRRLPTEAEWEKAARGPDANTYPWGNAFDGRLVNSCDLSCPFYFPNKSFNDGYSDVSPAGSYSSGKSVYGVLDMAGNVWEWVADWYSDTYYVSSPATNPTGPISGSDRVLRGGSWEDDNDKVRSSFRSWNSPDFSSSTHSYNLGFRCAMSAIP